MKTFGGKARPSGQKIAIGARMRVRRDRIDKGGKLTLRHWTRLHHIGVGYAHKGKAGDHVHRRARRAGALRRR
jgi:hypothetical protein